MDMTTKHKALVIGGGMAGLLAARVLSEHYDDVLVIERDTWPEKPEPRAGTPQAFHLHQLLPGGEMLLERFFPGYVNDLLALGAFPMKDTFVHMVNQYGTLYLPFSDIGMTCSRSLLEWVLRERVQALANVRFITQQEVTGLSTNTDRTRVTGIFTRQRGQLEQQTQLTANLVIDASGRFSKLSQWLEALDYQLPENERVTSAIGYSTRYYKIPPREENKMSLVALTSNPASRQNGGVLMTIENDTWAVCLTSVGGQYPPTDARAFEEELSSLISPLLADTLRDAEPLTEPRGYRVPECVRHHYEQMDQWPAGLLVMGDALCHFNPAYGQGITIAAIEAETLATSLREQQEPGFERRALQHMQEAIYPGWWLSTLQDLRWSGVTHLGPEPLKGVPLLHRYFDLCLKQSTQQLGKLMETGEPMNPQVTKYLDVNWGIITPREVINANMLNILLEKETPTDREAIIAELFQGYDQQNIDAVLDEVVPIFSTTFFDARPVTS